MSDKVELKPCPFCGGQAEIVCCDDEGNPRNGDYEQDPWSGIGYRIKHSIEKNENCPIARYEDDGATIGIYIYDTREEATQYWNKRVNNTAEKAAINPIDFEADVEKVQHGRWIQNEHWVPLPRDYELSYVEEDYDECYDEKTHSSKEKYWHCSRCDYEASRDTEPYFDYCPHCGARMDGETNEI